MQYRLYFINFLSKCNDNLLGNPSALIDRVFDNEDSIVFNSMRSLIYLLFQKADFKFLIANIIGVSERPQRNLDAVLFNFKKYL